MCYRGFTAEYDENSGVITGQFVIEQYAIKNTEDPDRVLAPVEIFPDIDAYDIRGMAYDYGTNGINGNNGVFGPLVLDDELSDEGKAAQENVPVEEPTEEQPAEEQPAAE